MKTAVQTVLIGKERAFNRRFVQMCGHYLVEPTACTPGAGWEKGQVENQVGIIRGRFFDRAAAANSRPYDELNAWLLDQCVAYARGHPHPVFKDRTVWQVFEDESSVPGRLPARPFDGFHAVNGVGVEDLPGALRQQQVQRGDARRRLVETSPSVSERIAALGCSASHPAQRIVASFDIASGAALA